MTPRDAFDFDRNPGDAGGGHAPYGTPMIRTTLNRADWTILLTLAVLWGGAFIFIGIAVRHVLPLTYVWLRLMIAAGAMWLFVAVRGDRVALPRSTWGSIALLSLLNNALPFTLFGWGQT